MTRPPRTAHARRSRPQTGATDRRRLAAASLSAVLPGLGQAANGQARLAAIFIVPSLLLVGAVWLVLQLGSTTRLVAALIVPATLSAALVLNGVVLLWRVAAVGQAFFDRRFPIRSGRLGSVGLVALLLIVALPHLVGLRFGLAARDTFARIFDAPTSRGGVAGATATPGPGSRERLNVLLIGIDKTPSRSATLTDTMIVVSLDPVGESVSMVSIPRDLVNVPLGTGDTFAPKLNSLMSWADARRDEFPGGGRRTLRDAVSALLGIPVHYTAVVDFTGFVRLVDTVGGVDVDVAKGFSDPEYGYRRAQGFSITAGRHHLDGLDALAFARSRKAVGESDFTRAARQQQILVALRDRVAGSGSLLFQLPALLDAVGNTIRTDFPVDRLPAVAALADEIGDARVVRVVIRSPLVHGGRNRYGSVQIPDLAAIRSMAEVVFTSPGTPPSPWPTPKPHASPRVTPAP